MLTILEIFFWLHMAGQLKLFLVYYKLVFITTIQIDNFWKLKLKTLNFLNKIKINNKLISYIVFKPSALNFVINKIST